MSEDHVPTTDEVCRVYAHGSGPLGTWSDRTAAFGRWLTAHDTRIASEAAEKALREFARRAQDMSSNYFATGHAEAGRAAREVMEDALNHALRIAAVREAGE